MTIFRNIENWTGDKANLVEKVSHVDSDGNLISSYEELRDKPLINGVVLQGDLTLDELNIQEKGDFALTEEVELLEKNIEENLTKKITNIEEAMPTKVSELENDTGYVITEEDPTVPGHVKDIKLADITRWNAKSDFSGSYNDLTDKPTINDFDNDFVTQEYVDGLIGDINSILSTLTEVK